jgi:hypothetical protein
MYKIRCGLILYQRNRLVGIVPLGLNPSTCLVGLTHQPLLAVKLDRIAKNEYKLLQKRIDEASEDSAGPSFSSICLRGMNCSLTDSLECFGLLRRLFKEIMIA